MKMFHRIKLQWEKSNLLKADGLALLIKTNHISRLIRLFGKHGLLGIVPPEIERIANGS